METITLKALWKDSVNEELNAEAITCFQKFMFFAVGNGVQSNELQILDEFFALNIFVFKVKIIYGGIFE